MDDLRTGFEKAEAYWFGHGFLAKFQITIRQGGLFWQNRCRWTISRCSEW